jgi:cytochrome c-type biogenesis protein CcmH/NrfG
MRIIRINVRRAFPSKGLPVSAREEVAMEANHDNEKAMKPEAGQWWYLPAVVALVGIMFFVVLRVMPAMT